MSNDTESLIGVRSLGGPVPACDSREEIEMERKIIKKDYADSLPYTLWQEREGMSAKLVAAFADEEDARDYGVYNFDREVVWYVRYFHGRKVFKSEDIPETHPPQGLSS